MTGTQLATAVLVVFLTSVMATIIVLTRGRARRVAFILLAACAVASLASWTRNGNFQDVYVDANPAETGLSRAKVLQHRPLHFHEFVHYYLGPKYFPEIGYLGLYGCVTLADDEIAKDENHQPRIAGPVRDLADILIDKPRDEAMTECRSGARTRFTEARWAAFKADIRDLAHLTQDGLWNGVVFDAGFNPPPSLVVFSYPLTNLIPIRSGSSPTYLLATCIDLVLLVVCFLVTRKALGEITTAVFATFFGATFISEYLWNGGSVLRFTWFVALVFGILALKQRRWGLAGALLGLATCDRIFPIAFAAAAMVPIAVRARRSPEHRAILRRFGTAFGVVVVVIVLVSIVMFGASSWSTFFARIINHDNVYHPQHLGLKKVLTFRDWVPIKNFHGHDGNDRYRAWNLALRATWSSMRPLVIPLQAMIAGATAVAASKRRPHEAALIGGVVYMFTFSLPANYYYCILALIPALLLRAAATATNPAKRWTEFALYIAFATFWLFTFVAPQLPGDDLIRTFRISLLLFLFLVGWIVAWSELRPPLSLFAAKPQHSPVAVAIRESTDDSVELPAPEPAPEPRSTAAPTAKERERERERDRPRTKKRRR
jgi:hypothetical protein